MEYGDVSDLSPDELHDMCVLSLQDRDPDEAAALLLEHHLGDRLRDGQIRNLAVEMFEDKLWEEHADMALHEPLFNVASLLFKAFPRSVPEPDAVRVILEVVATGRAEKEALAPPIHETFLVRLLADGMNDRSVLHRLFGEQLVGKSFPEADSVVWIVRSESISAAAVKLDLISSRYWLDPLRGVEAYSSTAYADGDG